jgi:hypothetical protein
MFFYRYMTETATNQVRRSYIIAKTFALLAGLFLVWLEWGFTRSWSNVGSMYGPPIGSAIAVLGLSAALIIGRIQLGLSQRISTYAAAVLVLMAFCFLIEITPIAQGNNDSGEVFWFIVLPAIWLTIYAYRSHSRSKTSSAKEARAWRQ